MSVKEDFEFLNSDLWLKYTQQRYVPLEDVRYRLEKLGSENIKHPLIQSIKDVIKGFTASLRK